MRLHIILLFFVLIIPVFSAYWYSTSGSYTVERPWEYSSWRCTAEAYTTGTILCESKVVTVIDWPTVYSESCGCDEDGCDTCYYCMRFPRILSMRTLGYRGGAWNPNAFERAINEMEIDVFAEMKTSDFVPDYENYSTVIRNLNLSYYYRASAEEYADACRESSSYTAHISVMAGAITFNQYRAIMSPGGYKTYSPCTSSEPSNPAGDYCKNYYVYWQNSVARAFDALKFSFMRADYRIESEARPLWNRMNSSGICDDDYQWDIGDACYDMKSAFMIIDGNVVEGTYGQYNSAKNHLEGLKQDVWGYPPNLTNYSHVMKLLWQKENGTIPLFSKLISDGNTAMDNAEEIYDDYIDQANAYKSEVNSKYSEMESDELSKITEALAVTHIEQESIGTIAQRYSTFEQNKLEAEQALSNATSMHGRTTTKGYLKKATLSAYNSEGIYRTLAGSADKLLEDAETVVEQQREQALVVLNQAKSISESEDTRAGALYQQAKRLFDLGDSASSLGDKFEYYMRAESYAWQALEEQEVITTETEDLILQVEDLIRRAEMDGINVATEEMLLSNFETEKDSRDISGDLKSLIASILEKADIEYGYLIDERSELLENITASEACGDDLRGVMENAEQGIISGGTIDYLNGIGRLKSLDEAYDEIAAELVLCENTIIVNSLIISQSLYVEKIKIDEPVSASLTLLITNPTHYSAENLVLELPLEADMQLLYSDITEGEEHVGNVLVEGNSLVLTLNELGPYWTRSISFEKDAVFARTINSEINAEGIGDGKARVEEITEFAVDADNVYLDLSGDYEVVSATVDGKSTNTVLERGDHTLVVTYVADDAYKVNRSDINAFQVGLNTQLTYKISVLPAIDIDTLPLTIDIEYGNVSGISISGASFANEECYTGYCEIELSNLKEDEEIVLSVSYMIINTDESDTAVPEIPESAYCIDGIDKQCEPLPAGINQTIAMINSANEAGDYATAIELREELKDEISAWQAEQQSIADDYQRLLSMLEDEKAEIDSALKSAGTATNSLIENLKTREAELESALSSAESATTIKGALSSLESVDSEWKEKTVSGYEKGSWEEYNSLKKRLFDAGITIMPDEFYDVETKMNSFSATGSLDDAVKLSLSLESAGNIVAGAEADVAEESEDLRVVFLDIKEDITSILDSYNEQQAEAEGTQWETLFTVDSSDISSSLEEIESMFGKEDNRLINKKIELVEKKKDKITKILDQLRDESERMLQAVRGSFEAKKLSLPGDIVKTVEVGLESMAGYITGGKYVNALKAGVAMLVDLGGYQTDEGGGINPVLIVLAVIAILAAVGVYYYKFRMGDGESELPFLKKQKKEYKRLERAEQ